MTTLQSILRLMQSGDWTGAHQRIQSDPSELAAWLHGILHLQEGDLEDAEYWYGKAGRNFRERGLFAQEIEQLEIALARSGINVSSS